MLLADKIYFKQEKGVITLTDKNGNPLSSIPKMWNLSDTNGKYTLTVKNEIIYDLPSTGHSGNLQHHDEWNPADVLQAF